MCSKLSIKNNSIHVLILLLLHTDFVTCKEAVADLRSCDELYLNGITTDGDYKIDIDGIGTGLGQMDVKCEFANTLFPSGKSIGRGVSRSHGYTILLFL